MIVQPRAVIINTLETMIWELAAVGFTILNIKLSRTIILAQSQIANHAQEVPLHDPLHGILSAGATVFLSRVANSVVNGVLLFTVCLSIRLGTFRKMLDGLTLLWTSRALMNVLTRLPSPTFNCRHLNPIFQAKNQCNDLMFSGHQAILCLCLYHLITLNYIGQTTFYCMAVPMALAIALSGNHYTIDTIVGASAAYILAQIVNL